MQPPGFPKVGDGIMDGRAWKHCQTGNVSQTVDYPHFKQKSALTPGFWTLTTPYPWPSLCLSSHIRGVIPLKRLDLVRNLVPIIDKISVIQDSNDEGSFPR